MPGALISPRLGRNSWQYKAIEATRGNQSQLGAIVLAVIGRAPKNPPYFTGLANITSDGFVMCNFRRRDGQFFNQALVCDVTDLTRNFRGLADHIKLDDVDRAAMFAEVRKWIYRDYRAQSVLF